MSVRSISNRWSAPLRRAFTNGIERGHAFFLFRMFFPGLVAVSFSLTVFYICHGLVTLARGHPGWSVVSLAVVSAVLTLLFIAMGTRESVERFRSRFVFIAGGVGLVAFGSFGVFAEAADWFDVVAGICAMAVLGMWFVSTLDIDRRPGRLDFGGVYFAFLAAGLVLFAELSRLLHEAGVGTYAVGEGEPAFFEHYFWEVLAMVPLVDAVGALSWDPPAAPVDTAAGWPVLLFRILVVVPLLVLARRLFPRREEETTESSPAPSPDP